MTEINEDWEEWDPSKTSFGVHVVAGSLAGVAEHMVVFPFDTVKTFVQAEQSGGRSELQQVLREEGRLRLWRGVSTTMAGCIPAHAGYFSIYEWGKVTFGADGENHAPLAAAFTGAMATVAHDSVMSPMDVIKQRMQLGFYSNVWDAIVSIVKQEGVAPLFRSFPVTLAMNIPFASVAVSTNESLKKVMNVQGGYSLQTFLVSGFVSGGVAGLFTTPLDVLRTRLNTQSLAVSHHATKPHSNGSRFSVQSSAPKVFPWKANGAFMHGLQTLNHRHPAYASTRLKYTRPVRCPLPIALWASPGSSTLSASVIHDTQSQGEHLRYRSPLQAAQQIWHKEGLRGFFRGAQQRMAVQAPGFAISWTAYETAKSLLMNQSIY